MGYLLAFCGGSIVAILALPVLINLFYLFAVLFDFMDLEGRPMEPSWLIRIKEKLRGQK